MGLLYFRLPFEPKSHFLPPNKKRAPALLSQHEIGGLNVYACIRIAPTHASRGGVRDDSAFAPRERERMTMYSTVAPRLFIALFLVFWPSPPSLSRSFLAHDQDLLAGCGARRCHLHPPPPIIQRVLYLSLPRDCFFHLTIRPPPASPAFGPGCQAVVVVAINGLVFPPPPKPCLFIPSLILSFLLVIVCRWRRKRG